MKQRSKQSGVTLIVVTIFLVLMALFAVAAFNTSTGNMKITGNMQIRQEAISAAQKAIEQTISGTQFTTAPTIVAATPISVSIDGAGVANYTVRMNPQPNCYKTKVIKSNELNIALAADLACIKSSKVDQGGFELPDTSANAGDSLCSNSEWNIGASVTDAASGTVVVANQGVAVRVLATDAANFCAH